MSEIDLELAALNPEAKALEAHKRMQRALIAFVGGTGMMLLPTLANATGTTQPPAVVIFLSMLLGGYVFWSVYLVFPPMWRKAWPEERSKIGCNPVTLLMAFVAFGAILGVSFLIGPLGGGIWTYAKLRKAVADGNRR